MKKLFLMIFAGVGIAGMLLCGCSKGSGSETSDSDSVNVEETLTEEGPEGTVYYITRDSIGPVRIGMNIEAVPDSVDGLYNKKVTGASPDAVTIEFSNANGESFVAYDFGEHKVDVVNLIGNYIKVKAPRGEFSLGDEFSRVLELPGVKAEWAGYDDTGMWYWTWEGLWFAPSQENLSETLTRRLYHSDMAPTHNDFSDDVTIGFIGTGLPF